MKSHSPLPTKPGLWAYLWPARQTPGLTVVMFLFSVTLGINDALAPFFVGSILTAITTDNRDLLVFSSGGLLLIAIVHACMTPIWHTQLGWTIASKWWTCLHRVFLEWSRKVSIDAALRYGLSRKYTVMRSGVEEWSLLARFLADRAVYAIGMLVTSIIILAITLPEIWTVVVGVCGAYLILAYRINSHFEKLRDQRRGYERDIENMILRYGMSPALLLKKDGLHESSQHIQALGNQATYLQKKIGLGSWIMFDIPPILTNLARVAIVLSLVFSFGWITDPIVQIPVIFMTLSVLVGTINNLSDMFWDYGKMKTDIDRLILMVRDLPLAPNLDTGEKYVPRSGDITFENVSFQYSEGKRSLESVNLTIKGGEHIALVGPSGAGKTTFVRLAMAYLLPTQGRILLDGQDTRELDLSTIVDHIGYLQQEPQLFDGSIRENLTYGLGDISEERLHKALRDAAADFVLDDLKEGSESIIGERGLLLSGGERQRLAIARLFLQCPSIIVLDEPTAALDSLSEAKVTEAIHRLSAGKTIITIAHRLQTVREADRIVVLKKGQIEAIGTHDELLKSSALYASMVDLQSGKIREEEEK